MRQKNKKKGSSSLLRIRPQIWCLVVILSKIAPAASRGASEAVLPPTIHRIVWTLRVRGPVDSHSRGASSTSCPCRAQHSVWARMCAVRVASITIFCWLERTTDRQVVPISSCSAFWPSLAEDPPAFLVKVQIPREQQKTVATLWRKHTIVERGSAFHLQLVRDLRGQRVSPQILLLLQPLFNIEITSAIPNYQRGRAGEQRISHHIRHRQRRLGDVRPVDQGTCWNKRNTQVV